MFEKKYLLTKNKLIIIWLLECTWSLTTDSTYTLQDLIVQNRKNAKRLLYKALWMAQMSEETPNLTLEHSEICYTTIRILERLKDHCNFIKIKIFSIPEKNEQIWKTQNISCKTLVLIYFSQFLCSGHFKHTCIIRYILNITIIYFIISRVNKKKTFII